MKKWQVENDLKSDVVFELKLDLRKFLNNDLTEKAPLLFLEVKLKGLIRLWFILCASLLILCAKHEGLIRL
jgi:hypothetical protein